MGRKFLQLAVRVFFAIFFASMMCLSVYAIVVASRVHVSFQADKDIFTRDRIELFRRRDGELKVLGEIRDQLKLIRSDLSRRNNGSVGDAAEVQ